MTRGNLRTRVLQALDDTTPAHWSVTQINDTLDDALQFLTEQARPFKTTIQLPLREGTNYYFTTGLGPEIMAPYRMWGVTQSKRLVATTLSELDQLYRRWVDVQGYPWVWAPISWDCFMIWPRPAAAGGILQVDCLAWPRPLQDDNDELEIQESDIDVIVDFAVYDSLLKRFDIEEAQDRAVRLLRSASHTRSIHGGEKIFSKFFHREPLNLPTGMPRVE